jgi:hypothetical protein
MTTQGLHPVCLDPDDDAVLALRWPLKPTLIISEDVDLLALGSYAEIPIVNAAMAIAKIPG